MKQFAALLVILILPVSAFAEVVVVVSGEHEGYTRLVLAITPDREWNLVTGQGTAKLVFPAQNLEFEDDGVFARIPRTRLVSTDSEQREDAAIYLMALGCDCEVSAFSYLDLYIVVDISDPPEASITLPVARHFAPVLSAAILPDGSDRPPKFVSWAPPQAPSYVRSPHRMNFPVQAEDVGLTPTQTPDAPPGTSHADVAYVMLTEDTEADSELQKAVDAARTSLLQQLTLAADQGLLNLNGPIPEILQAAEAVPEVDPEKIVEEIPDVLEELENENQVMIQTASMRDALAARGGVEQQNDHCPSPENLNIASWGSGTDFFNELSSARQRLLKEFDEPDFGEVERLVRTYLRYGFGAEARSYLLESEQFIAQQSLLLDLAAVVDGRTVQAGGPLSQAIDCDGVAGLWALVGAHPDADMHIDGKSSIIEAFADLPPDIRRLLGPRLASVFLDRGLESSARLVSDILERAPGDHGVEHDLIVGNLLLIEGGMPEAEETYRSLTEDNSEMATEALVELATFKLKQDGPPPEHLLLDLGAAAKILRGTQNGGELRRLEALWLAKLGREAEAIDMLIAEIETDPANAEIFHKTAEDILSALSLSTKLENNYAEIVNSYIEFTPKSADADWLRTEIAQKLLLSGMPNYAIVVLKPSLQRSKPDAISLAAEANILANRPDVALTLLKDATGDAARMLRVEAHLRAGNFDEALKELDQLTDRSSEIVSPHWFNGDWASVARSNSAAAKIRERYLVGGSGGGSGAHNFSEFMIGQSEADPITLSSVQELLVYSQSVSHELDAVLSQQ